MCYDKCMTNLSAAGLTTPEANCYTALLTQKDWKPADLAKTVNETRTNCYKILDKLVALGLAKRFDKDKKLHYRAASPARLVELVHEQRTVRERSEKELELQAQALMNTYFKSQEQAGIRYFQGKPGIQQIFDDMLQAKQPIYLLRSPADVKFYDEAFFEQFRAQRAQAGIRTYALTPDVPSAVHDHITDLHNKFSRTWLPAGSYDASVEWDIYDDKVALISYGEEALGIIIESPQIAESFRQILKLLQTSLKG